MGEPDQAVAEAQNASATAWLDPVHPDDRAAVEVAWGAAISSGVTYDIEYRLRGRAGGWHHIHACGVPVLDPAGVVREWVGTLTDVTEQRRAEVDRERLLREVEAERRQLAEVFRHAPSFMCVLRGPGHVFEWVNERYAELLGHRDLIGRPVRDAVPEVEGQGFFEILDRVYRTGEPFVGSDVRVVLRRGGGLEERVLDFVYQPLRDADGAVTGVLAHGIDLTDRVRAEAERAQAGEGMRALVRADHRVRVRELVTRAVAGRTEYDAEYPLERPVWLAARGRGLYDAAGNLTRMIGVFQDITVRKEAEARLRTSEERFRLLVEGVHDYAICMLEPDGRVASWNAGAERINGYPAERIVGRPFAALYTPEGAAAGDPERELGVAVADGRCEQEGWRAREDGTRFWANGVITALRDAGGQLIGYLMITRDLTAHRLAEEKLRQSQKMEAVGHLAGGVAHDFNNLLTVINGYAAVLLDGHPPGEAAEAAAEILSAGKRAAELTRQLLAFGRRQVLRATPLDLNELVTNLTRMVGRLIGEDVLLTTTLRPSLGLVTADHGQIEQVIVNLCVNARDAMPQGGRLTIKTDAVSVGAGRPHPTLPPGRYARVSVADTGCGMTDEVRARVFEPFFTTKGVGEGSGLGLSTAIGIVEQSGGRIEVVSAVGRGTTFEVYLPVTGDRPVVPREREGSACLPPRGRETVLLVEDERAVRALTARLLRGAGYEVLEAAGGGEAIRACAAANGPVRLLLTDVVMPNESGRELAERLKATMPGLRVLFMSGYTDDLVVRHGVRSSEAAFVQKPFEVGTLLEKVRQVLDDPATGCGSRSDRRSAR